ncbi:hypothetical protein BJX66DRAFT_71924 [Aspergillus keveii]|uniref:Uncharacterized protein n=1 Tax=Aspergillus keveii TaxID=714993 RepID=A0ABR4GFU2_9EURO
MECPIWLMMGSTARCLAASIPLIWFLYWYGCHRWYKATMLDNPTEFAWNTLIEWSPSRGRLFSPGSLSYAS